MLRHLLVPRVFRTSVLKAPELEPDRLPHCALSTHCSPSTYWLTERFVVIEVVRGVLKNQVASSEAVTPVGSF